ncbi:MAG: rRNA pseudouridine synthase [Dorea sp.]|nr:rRNA pseudouridine synthase [Dorea sp.]
MIRLDKYLANMDVGTRQEVKKMIRQGLVTVDDKVVKSGDLKIDEDSSVVKVRGEEIGFVREVYYMLHKPAGVISATEDRREKTILDLMKDAKGKNLFPVGRLDKDTEGLLLVTNDGMLAHNLLSPKKHVDKVYYAHVKGFVTEKDVERFAAGLDIGSEEQPEPVKPGKLVILKSDEISEIRLTIQEGKFHQVKRMFEAVGKEVIYLKRESMGPLVLDEALAKGEYRELTDEERNSLLRVNV